MSLSKKAARELAAKNQIDFELLRSHLKDELQGDMEQDAILRVPYRIGVTLYRSMAHASLFFRSLRDDGLFYGAQCPDCGRKVFPPQRPVCSACIKKGKLVEYSPLLLGKEIFGQVLSWSRLVRGTSKHVGHGELYPAIVRVDEMDNAVWQYVLPGSGKMIEVGSKVHSVVLPQEERTGEVTDFAFSLL